MEVPINVLKENLKPPLSVNTKDVLTLNEIGVGNWGEMQGSKENT